jgi:hypothetical protein
MNEEFDITGSIRIIEWLKTELLESVTSLFKILLKGARAGQDAILDCLAGIIILTYLLARRLGVEFSSVDMKVQNKLKVGIIEEDSIEKDHGDLTRLLGYIRERKQV